MRYHETEQVTQVSRVNRLEARLYEVYDAMELDVHRAVRRPGAPAGAELARPWTEVPTDPRLVSRLKALIGRAGNNVFRIGELLETNRTLRARIETALEVS